MSSGEAEAFVRLPRASLTSLAAEAVAEQIGLLDHAQKSHWQALRGLWLTSARAHPGKATPAPAAPDAATGLIE